MPSINPKNFATGGIVPVDQNLTWKKCRYGLYEYKNKAGDIVATTIAALITYLKDDGEEVMVPYSVGDPNKWQANPADGGKTLVSATGDESMKLSTSSNFFLLMNNVASAGFPENKFPDNGDLSVFDGMVAHHIGLPEPARSGLKGAEPRADGRERVISVPDKIITLPGVKKAATGKGAAAAPAADVTKKLLAFVGTAIDAAEGNTMTRQELASAIISSKEANKEALAGGVFNKTFATSLLTVGLQLDGETISKIE